MALFIVTGPQIEPVSVSEARLQLQNNYGDDVELNRFIVAARQHVENFTERKLITQTWDQKLYGFPCGVWTLPWSPVSSITSITYIDGAGDAQTWSAADYQTDLPSGPWAAPAKIAPGYGKVYPTTRLGVFSAVTCRFVAGYGIAPADVPEPIRQAILMLVSHWSMQRSATTEDRLADVPQGVDQLLWPFKLFPGGQ